MEEHKKGGQIFTGRVSRKSGYNNLKEKFRTGFRIRTFILPLQNPIPRVKSSPVPKFLIKEDYTASKNNLHVLVLTNEVKI